MKIINYIFILTLALFIHPSPIVSSQNECDLIKNIHSSSTGLDCCNNEELAENGLNITCVSGKISSLVFSEKAAPFVTFESLSNIANLANLQGLTLHGLSLSKIPATIGELKQLNFLQVSKNPMLKNLSSSFCELSALTDLKIFGNALTSLPNCFNNFTSLEKFHIQSEIFLTSLPISLGDAKSVKKVLLLNLPNLTSLPTSFSQLQNLDDLYILGTKIPSVQNLQLLTGLKQLSLFISASFPQGVEKLNLLESLTLSGATGSIPAYLNTLTNLKSVFLQDNNLSGAFPDLSALNLEFFTADPDTGLCLSAASKFPSGFWKDHFSLTLPQC
ncbi:hypothetical protein HDU92_002687 [Lobulomyces angularis]|nr:hypothetical protein HDU92_002687 [Lobulomyces angularis]